MEFCGGKGKGIVINCFKAFTYLIKSQQPHLTLLSFTKATSTLRGSWSGHAGRKTSAMMKSYNKSALLNLEYQTVGHYFFLFLGISDQ